MKNKAFLMISIYTVLVSCNPVTNTKDNKITWATVAKLPVVAGMQKQLGVAGVFTGVSNDVLLIAGGSNFADGAKPWQGGKKLHRDDIYILKKEAENKFSWLKPQPAHLKQNVAYGASVTLPEGVVCAGGETDKANSSREVFMMQWDASKNEVLFKEMPSLPIPVANACMANIGRTIYLIGGESNGKPSAKCFLLDLSSVHPQWQPLPDLPVAMSHSVAVAQSNGNHSCIYVIGGRSSTPSGISDLHNTTFCYDPTLKKWLRLKSVGDGENITNLSAATGVSHGNADIIVIGGDKGNVFHQIETYNAKIEKAQNETEKQKLQNEKLELLNNHQGFSKDVYQYNTLTDTWKKIGELPFYGQVTTTAVKWGNDIFIPCGEIKPGVRTENVVRGEFK
ncbi:galactose oxidase [Mucilaginibacter sp. HMF7410]|uniref:Galactose oxidase n=2 Tax=Mucilaginibacter arboris TaxID=2682090 RepID=A0A7K1ST03_9SPHI|nr:galactose oxidase [Mucilaginibacter arboris]